MSQAHMLAIMYLSGKEGRPGTCANMCALATLSGIEASTIIESA